MDRAAHGRHFEAAARTYLEGCGLRCITLNYHCRWGEIDLVMEDSSSLVFVEVRYRGPRSYVSGTASVDARKRRKLCKTALYYLSRHANADKAARFDIVSVSADEGAQSQFEWTRNAFECRP